jgi:hypothetical protein
MSFALRYNGSQANPKRPFFLCIKKQKGKPEVDEWSEQEAQSFPSPAKALECVKKLELNPKQIVVVPHPFPET